MQMHDSSTSQPRTEAAATEGLGAAGASWTTVVAWSAAGSCGAFCAHAAAACTIVTSLLLPAG